MEDKKDSRTEFASNKRIGNRAIIMGKREIVLKKFKRDIEKVCNYGNQDNGKVRMWMNSQQFHVKSKNEEQGWKF